MLQDGDGVGLNISDMMRVPIMAPFHANNGSDLTKEWINILDTVRLHELEIGVGYNIVKKILDKSYLLIDWSITNNY